MEFINFNQDSAGVYDALQDSSQFSPQVSETIAGYIGPATKGIIGIPVLCTGQADFINKFGLPLSAGALGAYLMLGQINQVYFTRLASAAAVEASGVIVTPATSATLTGVTKSNYTFLDSLENRTLLMGMNGGNVQSIQFDNGSFPTADVVTILQAVFTGEGSVVDNSGNIKITSVDSGIASEITILDTPARVTLGLPLGTFKGTSATAGFVTSTNAAGVWAATPFNSTSRLDVKFNNDADLSVSLTGSFIDGIDNVVDLVDNFTSYAQNNISLSLANSAVIEGEKVRFVSPTQGATSIVEILSSTTSDVISVLGLSGVVALPASGDAATSATVTSTKKQGFDLSSSTTLKFKVDALAEKTITFNTSGNPAYSELFYTSGLPVSAGLDVLVDDWTFHFEAASGNLNTSTNEFDVAQGSTSVESYSNLADAINLYVDSVIASHSYNSGTLSGELSITAASPGKNGNSIIFDADEITSFYDTKNPTDNTLGYGNGSVLTDLSQSLITNVVKEVNRQAGGLYAYESDGSFQLTSNTTGSGSYLEITGANQALGLTSGRISIGENQSQAGIITAKSTGTWANGKLQVVTGADNTFTVVYNGAIKDTHKGSTISALSDYIENVINANSEYINFEYTGGVGDSIPAGQTITLAGGNDGSLISDTEIVNAIQAYDDSENISINLFAAPGLTSTATLQAIDALSEKRQDVFCVADTPVGYTAQEVVNWHNGIVGSGNTFKLDNKYIGLFWPWCRINDDITGTVKLVPPSILVMELIAKNDREQQPYTAPAGTLNGKLTRAISVETSASLDDRNLLYKTDPANVINPIINKLGKGIIIYGQKTTQRELTNLNRINVSRLLVYVRKRVRAIADDIVFQPNDEVSWNLFTSQVRKFLDTIVAARGINRYDVIMDSTINTPLTIAEGKLYGFIRIQPRLVAEQIILTYEVVGQDFQFVE